MLEITLTDTFQYESQFVDTDNITLKSKIKEKNVTDKLFSGITFTCNDQDYSILHDQAVCLVICEVFILLACGKHNYTISLRGEVWSINLV